MTPGDAYWITDLVGGKQVKHLHVILTHPEPDDEGELQVAVVNVSTVRSRRYDDTVVLKKSDYAGFAEQLYYVAYVFANFQKVEHIRNKPGYAAAAMPFHPRVFQRIFEGTLKLDGNTPESVRKYCSDRVGPTHGQVLKLLGGR